MKAPAVPPQLAGLVDVLVDALVVEFLSENPKLEEKSRSTTDATLATKYVAARAY